MTIAVGLIYSPSQCFLHAIQKMAQLTETNANAPSLLRELGVSQASAIVVGTIIGSGIFLVPAEMMQAVGSARLVYLAWIVGGVLSMAGAITYAELGAMKPQAGGEYIYIRDAYGELPAFLYGWTWFAIAKPGSIATIATGIVRILGTFPVLAFFNDAAVKVPFVISYGQLVAIAAAALITWLNYVGVKRAGEFQLVFTILKVVMIACVGVIGFTAASGTWRNFGTHFTGATGGIAGFMAALVAALWAYDGWNDLNMVSGEIRRPERTIPIALIAGVGIVAVLYMLTNAAVQYVLPAASIAASPRPASEATAIAVGLWGAAIVSAGMALSMLVTLNGTIMSGARIPYAMARDGYFFKAMADVHPRFHTPSVALVVQLVLSVILLLFAGSFRALFSLTIFSEWLFYMIAASTVFVLRWKEPSAPRPYRTWGYPVVPAVFVLVAAVLLYYTFQENLRNSIWGCGLILSGIPVFLWFARKRARAE
jgi:APA family basic amino acid/polyamine antiporter